MILVKNNYPISRKSFVHIGGIVREYVECDNLFQTIEYLKDKNFISIGNTSKILFAFDYSEMSYFCFLSRKVVFFDDCFFAYSGISLNNLNYVLMKKGISGFEYLATIPGCLGGSIVNNSSFLDQCISSLLIKILVYENGKLFFINKEDIDFSYRSSGLIKNNFLVVGAFFETRKLSGELIRNRYKHAVDYRKKYQEVNMKTLGSTFKNVGDLKVGFILDKLGYRGFRYSNSCCVSSKHANFILVEPYSNYCEFYNLIKLLKKLLYNYLQKEIVEEIQIIFGNGKRDK